MEDLDRDSYIGFYDRDGKPMDDVLAWAKKQEGEEGYKRVASTQVGDAWISTVWVGLDMGALMGPPLIFETMVFGGPLDQEQERYATEWQARRGHKMMVTRVRQEVLRESVANLRDELVKLLHLRQMVEALDRFLTARKRAK